MFLNEFFKLQEQDQPSSALGKIGGKISSGIAKAVNPAMAGLSAYDTLQSVYDKDYTGAALSAGSTLAYGAGSKFPAIAGPAFAVGAGLDTANILRDPEIRAEIKQAFKKPFQGTPALAARGRGRNVLPAKQEPVDENIASPELIQSIIDIESGGREDAVSPKGAMGRMQVMPATAKNPGFGITPAKDFSSQELERVGQDYFNVMLNRYGGDKKLALIAYNMGPGAADKWLAKGGDTSALPAETQAYVPKVLGQYAKRSKDQTLPGIAAVSPRPAQPRSSSITSLDISPKSKPSLPSQLSLGALASFGAPYASQTKKSEVPDSETDLEQMIRNRNKLDRNQLSKLIKLFRSNPQVFSNIDRGLIDILQSLSSLKNNQLTESMSNLADQIYFDLESRYDDLVRLYGHEVVGDAIETVVIKNENSLDVDIEDLSSQVLKLLRKRIEPEETLEDSDNVIQNTETEQKNAMIQIQADVDKLKNVMGVKESKIYYNVLATSESDLRQKFGLRKDRNGWYLKESAGPSLKFDAMRAFGIL
jgi:hypothetical protein